MSIKEEKADLRRRVWDKMEGLSPQYIENSDRAIEKRLLSSEEFLEADGIFTYNSMGREVSTAGIIRAARELGKKVALPISLPGGKMFFRYASSGDRMRAGKYGIMEPDGDGETACPTKKSLIIVPALAFSRDLYRLGRGGGYYDRFLAQNDGIAVGLCRAKLLLDEVPIDSFDIPVSAVIWEEGTIRKRTSEEALL